jgi:hypothetical protein
MNRSFRLRSLVRPAAGLSAALALGFGLPGVALAQPAGDGGRLGITPAQWQKVFPDFRQQALKDNRARIGILQRGERCISAAGSGDALRSCMREERSAMQQQRSESRTAMRLIFERNGITVPERRWGQGGPGRPGADGPAGGI